MDQDPVEDFHEHYHFAHYHCLVQAKKNKCVDQKKKMHRIEV